MKRVYQWILTLTLLMGVVFCMAIGVSAEEVIASGSCGSGVSWSLDDAGVLTISGTGSVNSYANRRSPWYGFADQIKSIVIENEITSLPQDIFYGCSSLESITIPFVGNSVKTASDTGQYPFGYIFGTSSYTGSTATIQYYYGSSTNSTAYSTYYIPSSLKSVTVTGGNILHGAFDSCNNLTSVTIGGSVVSIEDLAFVDCRGLTCVTIGNRVTNIGAYAFKNCTNLTSVTIPASVTSIGKYAFYYCTSLMNVYITDLAAWCNIDFDYSDSNPLYYADNLYLNGELITELVIPNGVTSIGNYALSCNSLTSITIPDSVTSIGRYAFYDCSSLTSVTIPDSVTSIGNCAFYKCSSLTNVYISDIATWCNIDFGDSSANPLYYADNLYLNGRLTTQLVIPDRVTSIGDYAFYNCTNLISVIIGDNVTIIGKNTFRNCSSLISVILGDSVISIGDSAFSWCDNLTSIIIPDSVTGIGEWAFYNCSSLTSVTLGDSVTSIGKCVFSGCSSLISVTLPNNVTNIGYQAFYNCSSLTSITIPDNVNRIDDYAFYNCSSLTNVSITDISAWCNIDFGISYSNPLYYATNLYLNEKLITELEIPNSVTSIGDYAFSCTNLISITIPDSVTNIGNYAFCNCTSLISVNIANSVTSIGDSAFANCSSLINITIPDSIAVIKQYTFSNCSSLRIVSIPTGTVGILANAFNGCSQLEHIAYGGTEAQWMELPIAANNTALTSAVNIHYETAFQNRETCEEYGIYCPVCKKIIYTFNADGAHTYGQWVTVKPATFTAEGLQEKTCTVCGGDSITEAIPVLVGEVSKWNVALADDLLVNYYLNISESIENTAKVRIVVGEAVYTFRVSQLEKTEDGLYIARVSAAAAQMNDFIYVTVINSGSSGQTFSYTIRQYADTILADETHSAYHALVKEMLNYGAAAQVYFDYEAGNLVNAGITGTGNVEIPDSVDDTLSVEGKANGISFYGASLIFRDKIAVRYYFGFEGQINNMTFTVNNQQYAPQLKDGLYYIEIADILPQNLDQQITLTVTDANGNILTVTYGPMNYIVRMNQKGTEPLQNLLKALYNYHLAAKALTA